MPPPPGSLPSLPQFSTRHLTEEKCSVPLTTAPQSLHTQSRTNSERWFVHLQVSARLSLPRISQLQNICPRCIGNLHLSFFKSFYFKFLPKNNNNNNKTQNGEKLTKGGQNVCVGQGPGTWKERQGWAFLSLQGKEVESPEASEHVRSEKRGAGDLKKYIYILYTSI